MGTPHVDCGDNVIIINASKARFTWEKLEDKNYYTHSGYFGSTKTHKMSDMLENNPEKLFKLATRGMLPKTTLGKAMLKKLKVYATGRRKTSIAKVWLEAGNGQLTINGQSLDAWLGGLEAIKKRVKQPIEVSKQETSVNIVVKTLGGGYSAQADAVRHGISRALVAYDEQFRTILKPYGLLTRDARAVERKKYGRKKAKKS